MLERVEVRVPEGNLADNMKEMRTWLDYRRLEPNAFRCTPHDDSILIRVDFADRKDADAFAQQFGGRTLAAPVS